MVKRYTRALLVLAALLALTAACAQKQAAQPQLSTPVERPVEMPQPTAKDLEGVYEREATREAAPGATERQIGGWTLLLEDGGFVIRFESFGDASNSFESSGRYAVRGGDLVLTRDKGCPEHAGTYAVELDGGTLTLTTLDDDCGGGLRASDLTVMPWGREAGP